MPQLSFNVSYYYTLLLTINFHEQFLKLNFKNSNLSLKITYKDKITDIKKIVCKIATAVNIPCAAIFIVFRQFLKLLATSNTCIFVNIAWKVNCDILKSQLILCEWNAFYFIEIAFIGFTRLSPR